jgi:sortase A
LKLAELRRGRDRVAGAMRRAIARADARLPQLSPRRSRFVERVLVAFGVLSLGYCAFALVEAEVYDAWQTRRLERMRADEQPVGARMAGAVGRAVASLGGAAGADTAGTTAPSAGPWLATATREEAAGNGFVGRMEIARLGLSAVISEGVHARAIRRAVGHVPGTAFPGEVGNVGIAGHRDRHFRPLRDVEVGDRIDVTTPDGDFVYLVDDIQIVAPDATEVLAATDEPVLTLVTCYPFWYLGHAPERFIVRARLAEGGRGEAAAAVAAR